MGPPAGNEATVPADHRLRLHDQQHAREASTVEACSENRQDGPVGLGELGTSDLAPQHHDLMAHSKDLSIAFVTRSHQEPKTLQDHTNQSSEHRRTVPNLPPSPTP